mmetsp:Transcript_59262/g.108587  ORF Transcript_59262/g.108587 Transcript_59262/m.108587 type:complete len:252 (+) Transcript_59262:269-1024(+)
MQHARTHASHCKIVQREMEPAKRTRCLGIGNERVVSDLLEMHKQGGPAVGVALAWRREAQHVGSAPRRFAVGGPMLHNMALPIKFHEVPCCVDVLALLRRSVKLCQEGRSQAREIIVLALACGIHASQNPSLSEPCQFLMFSNIIVGQQMSMLSIPAKIQAPNSRCLTLALVKHLDEEIPNLCCGLQFVAVNKVKPHHRSWSCADNAPMAPSDHVLASFLKAFSACFLAGESGSCCSSGSHIPATECCRAC